MNEVNNNTSPAISVIVPVYNAEKTLRQCVDSILAQEYKDFELLLIDDGSKDGSPAICDKYAYKDARIRVFHKENGGVSSARNVGLDNARGEWITFIDSDDFITEGYFDGVVGREEDLLFISCKTLYHDKIIKSISLSSEHTGLDFSTLISENINNNILRGPCAKFFKRDIIASLRFVEEMSVGEDACFVFSYLSKCHSFHVLQDADYMIVYCGIPDDTKYSMTVHNAILSLMNIKEEFEEMANAHFVNKGLFLSYINYYKRISKSDWQNDKPKWYGNKGVKALYKYVWSALTIKQKTRLTVARLLRR